MSIEKTPNGDWRVRWREGGRNRAKVIGPRKQDAKDFEAELKRHKRMGTLPQMDMGTENFEDFLEHKFWPRHAAALSPEHQKNVGYNLDKYIVPRFGGYRLREITRGEVEAFMAELRAKTGGRAQQTVLRDLKTILNRAVDWELLASNPAANVKMPKHERKRIDPPTPLEVERVREGLLQAVRPGDATLVAVLAYAGLRPQEALALTWDDIRDRTILVGAEHKTGHRSVDLWQPLAVDLAEWKLASGQKHHLVFPSPTGKVLNWRNWRARVWEKYKEPGMGPPYWLRHLHSSLMLREDRLSLFEQAAQAGHSVELHTNTYGHLISELKGKGSAEAAIRQARAEVARAAATG